MIPMKNLKTKVAEWLDCNVWDGDELSTSTSRMRDAAHKATFTPNDLHELVVELIEDIKEEEKK